MRIAVVVHGRFHAFDLARELLRRSHEVTVFTNHPAWSAERFGIPRQHVMSCWLEGGLDRLTGVAARRGLGNYPESFLHQWFGRWAARHLAARPWDVAYCLSGSAEEPLRALGGTPCLRHVVRGSSHIRVQATILEAERRRTGLAYEGPSSWIIAREEREYALADRIVVLSRFAHDTFVAEGISPEKLLILPLGAQLNLFRPTEETIDARCRRIAAGAPLTILYVGALTLRKGLRDLAEFATQLDRRDFRIRLIGPISREVQPLLRDVKLFAELIPPQPQQTLPQWYAAGDIFVFPTLEDGFANTLAQAHASALPILCTTNCGGPDIIREGDTGWILPIRRPDAFLARLRWCHEHRRELVTMVRRSYTIDKSRDWSDMAQDFETACLARLGVPNP